MREAAYAGIGKADLAERHAYLAGWAAPGRRSTDAGHDGAGRPEPPRASGTLFVAHPRRARGRAGRRVRPAPRRGGPHRGPARRRRAEPAGPARARPRASRAPRSSTPSGRPRWPATRCRSPTGWCTPARCCRPGPGRRRPRATPRRSPPTPATTPARRAERAAGRRPGVPSAGRHARAVAAWQRGARRSPPTPSCRPSGPRRCAGSAWPTSSPAGSSQASSRFAAAYQVNVAAGDEHGQAWSLQNLAWVTTTRGDFAGTDAVLAGPPGSSPSSATRSAGPGCAARPRTPGCSPAGWPRPAGWPGSSCRSASGSARRWAVGTLRAVEAFAAAELGDLAEADREARRAYRDFAAVSDDWGRGLLAGRPRGGRARPGRAGARDGPAHRRAGVRRTDRPSAADRHGRHHPRFRGPATAATATRPSGTRAP